MPVSSEKVLCTALGFAGLTSLLTASVAEATEADPGADSKDSSTTVVVTGKRASLDLLPETILDTPQSINVVSAELIQKQAATSLTEALKNVPGITLNAGEGGTHGDLVNLRGFSAGDDYFMDGLRDTGLYDRDVFNYEALEIYKGPASTLFGRGSTGGVINQIQKTPHLAPSYDFSATGGTNSEARATADVNIPVAETLAVRLNAMGMRSLVEGRPFVRNERWGVAPAIGFGIDTDTSLTLKYLHQNEDNLPDYGVPFLFDRPAPVPRDTFYGLPADDRFQTKVDVVTLRFQHTFSPSWTVSDTARYGNYYFLSRQTAAIYGSGNCFTSSGSEGYFAGAPMCTSGSNQVPVTANNPYFPVSGTPVGSVYVLRDRPSGSGTIKTAMNDLDFTTHFSTGLLTHTMIFGAEYDDERADLVRFANQDTIITPVPLLAPDPFEAFPGTQTTVTQKPSTRTHTVGVYTTDTIGFGPHWDLTAAIRYDSFHAGFEQPLGNATSFDHTDNIWSPRAALVYKPTEQASVYFSYGTSFNPSAENLALSASNQALPPEKDRTFELGAKAQILQGSLAVTGAIFDTEMTNARISDPLQPTLQALSGTEKVRGVEVGLQGYLTPEWEITAGYTYLDATAVGLAGPGIEGPVPNTAHNQANLWTTYEVRNWQLGTGLNFLGERQAGTDTQFIPGSVSVPTVPGYVTWDAMAGYRFSKVFSVQVNALNLTDRFYYVNSYFTRPNENHTVPGAGRTVLFSAHADL